MKQAQASILFAIVLVFLIPLTFCSSNQEQVLNKRSNLTLADSIWFQFARNMEIRNIDYLIKNSLDTIQCTECEVGVNHNNYYYNAKMIFDDHLDKLMHLDSLTNREHSTYMDDNEMHVIYSIETNQYFEGYYGLIFNFKRDGNKYLFSGMVLTP